MDLIVCPSAALAEVCGRYRPSHVLSMASPGRDVPPLATAAERLVVAFNDIGRAQPGLIAPDRRNVEAIVGFGRRWDGERPCVLQCEFGVSRSPAAAYIIACARCPHASEVEIAVSLRAASPVATPNALMVSIADDLLDRGGRMIAAVAAIGRGAGYRPYTSFRLSVACLIPA